MSDLQLEEVHLGDLGTSFEVEVTDSGVVVPIGDASVLKILFKKPSGDFVEKTAELKTDGSDGILRYVSVGGDIDQKGEWTIQGRVVLPSGTFSTSKGCFEVFPNLDS